MLPIGKTCSERIFGNAVPTAKNTKLRFTIPKQMASLLVLIREIHSYDKKFGRTNY